MPLNKHNQEESEEFVQGRKPFPKSAPEENAFDDPEALAAIIKGLLNGRLE
ncbi:hypothetical protein SDC9_195011 [bioreactor metagenome]|uniref:Uncharacterized protein n=1 Tax=bioreactor metagenome TaxID=1076179 RepID=A0A645IAD7_9ZZZZ|nr:hypothetical protein [Oscillibacter sp.]